MEDHKLRWGILGTAGIARKNWKAICLSENARVAAVASRNRDSAQRFINECSAAAPASPAPVALGSYAELLEREDIDAVYIPLPTALRYEWVVKAAESGKHVLGEKPAASNAEQVAEMLAACAQHDVQYMDGVMFMHSRRLEMLRRLIDDENQIGTLRRLASQFSFAGDQEFLTGNIRTNSQLEPYGCLGDLGWYCIRMFLWILRGQMPVEVRARTLTAVQGQGSPGKVPGEFSGELLFANGVSASFYNAFITENQQWLHMSGSRGYLRVDDFVLPYHGCEVVAFVGQDVFHVENCEFHMENHVQRHAVREYDAHAPGAQETRMIETFSALAASGKLDESWPQWALKTQRVLDACMESARRDGVAVHMS